MFLKEFYIYLWALAPPLLKQSAILLNPFIIGEPEFTGSAIMLSWLDQRTHRCGI